MRTKNGVVKPLILTLIVLLATIGTGYYWLGSRGNEIRIDDQLLFEAFEGEFVSTIMETGTVESSENVKIKCEVKSRGSAGTAILYIIEEGAKVKAGDVLVKFDDIEHKDRLFEQEIELEKNRAALIQATSDLKAAEKMLIEYGKKPKKEDQAAQDKKDDADKNTSKNSSGIEKEGYDKYQGEGDNDAEEKNEAEEEKDDEDKSDAEEKTDEQSGKAKEDEQLGTYNQERLAIELEIAVAKENLERAEEYLKFSEKLNAKNFIQQSELRSDEFAVFKAKKELKLAEDKLKVLTKLTYDSTREQLLAEIERQKANQKAAQITVKLSETRVQEFKQQVANCTITAPKAGQVVYANENDRENSIVIEEGTIIRDQQEVIFLPDPNRMQVRTKVNDSKINLVEAGDEVEIRLDSTPDVVIRGKVRKKADFPLPQRWYQAPIEYEVFVDITEKNPLVKSGLRAKSKIIVDRQQNVLQVPASSIVRRNDAYYAIVAENNRYVAREVKVGANNDKFVIIKSGLSIGDKVLINPEKTKDKLDYPGT